MVTKASGHGLTVNLSTGDDTIDAGLLTTTTNAATINATKASADDHGGSGDRKPVACADRQQRIGNPGPGLKRM